MEKKNDLTVAIRGTVHNEDGEPELLDRAFHADDGVICFAYSKGENGVATSSAVIGRFSQRMLSYHLRELRQQFGANYFAAAVGLSIIGEEDKSNDSKRND